MEHKKAYLLSASQLKFYLDFAKHEGTEAGSMALLYRWSAEVDADRLAEAISQAINNHQMARLRLFLAVDGVPRQRVEETYRFTQRVEEMSDSEFEQARKTLKAPFHLWEEPLFHSRLIKTPSACYWLFDVHHIVIDASALTVLFAEMDRAYRGEPLLPEVWGPCEIAERERCYLAQPEGKRALSALCDQWAACEGCFPTPDKQEPEFSVKLHYAWLDLDMQELNAFTRRIACSLSALTAAACCLLLAAYSGNRRAAVVTAFNNRNLEETRQSVGMISRYLLLGVPMDLEMTVATFLGTVQRHTEEGRAYGFANLEAMRQLGKDFVDFMPFVFQGRKTEIVVAGESVSCTILPMDGNRDMKPFSLHFMVEQGRPRVLVIYQGHRYSEAFVSRFVENYQTVLRRLLTETDTIAEVMAFWKAKGHTDRFR